MLEESFSNELNFNFFLIAKALRKLLYFRIASLSSLHSVKPMYLENSSNSHSVKSKGFILK
ncbi:hypothetical protein LEP1GSC059_0010 [Leptospira phage vB_LnoZ_CZ214-LE1]|nr:hypothetical protein LEP1GSC059_0010 [Leptospira phage vB_LnoZ_CZ214-LE1]